MSSLTPKRREYLRKYFSDDELEQFDFPNASLAPRVDWDQRFREAYLELYRSIISPPFKTENLEEKTEPETLPWQSQAGFDIERLISRLDRGEEAGSISQEFLQKRLSALHRHISRQTQFSANPLREIYRVWPFLVFHDSKETVPCRRAALIDFAHSSKTYRIVIGHFDDEGKSVSFYQLSTEYAVRGAGYFETDDHETIRIRPVKVVQM